MKCISSQILWYSVYQAMKVQWYLIFLTEIIRKIFLCQRLTKPEAFSGIKKIVSQGWSGHIFEKVKQRKWLAVHGPNLSCSYRGKKRIILFDDLINCCKPSTGRAWIHLNDSAGFKEKGRWKVIYDLSGKFR